MSTITKQWLQQTIAEMEEHRDLFPGDLDDNHGKVLAAFRIALASLEAEPVGFIHPFTPFTFGKSSGAIFKEETRHYYKPVYVSPPAPVSVPDYPETLPCPVMLEPGLRFGKGVPTKTMLGALQRRAEYYAEVEAMTPDQRANHDAGIKELAAMLQGAENAESPTTMQAAPALDSLPKIAESTSGNSPMIPAWQAKAEKLAELHGSSFVVFRNGESPQCADPSKVIISFTGEGLGHVAAAPQQEAK